MSLKRTYFPLMIVLLSITSILSENKLSGNKRTIKSHPFLNVSATDAKHLKLHSKILQTVYSDSFSKNFYYTTLYIGDQKVRQTYIIDTGSSIMSSPCSLCHECGSQKDLIIMI